jgi:hypothetical protein
MASNGETEWAYGFASALDAHNHRSAMVAAADAGRRIATCQAFEVMFPRPAGRSGRYGCGRPLIRSCLSARSQ